MLVSDAQSRTASLEPLMIELFGFKSCKETQIFKKKNNFETRFIPLTLSYL